MAQNLHKNLQFFRIFLLVLFFALELCEEPFDSPDKEFPHILALKKFKNLSKLIKKIRKNNEHKVDREKS